MTLKFTDDADRLAEFIVKNGESEVLENGYKPDSLRFVLNYDSPFYTDETISLYVAPSYADGSTIAGIYIFSRNEIHTVGYTRNAEVLRKLSLTYPRAERLLTS